ncbi:hypothetical protein [Lichenifustis flavocetrariae]|uniref:2,4-diaminopentanoate dehydrogenase C-terminal domain-containing protein n=1 Tax=Lichenifustis flavocetrariae TaxID=2949735 RepID=A0AA41Z369_9HYPH|nr:hypothetical protein [Lichenifustis flavocetrariae]MCW6512161.1 hypothetical protein [Lichenifustis flavocetrariae]
MRPAILWGFGSLGRALATAIGVSRRFDIVAVIDTDPSLVGRTVSDLVPASRCDARVLATLDDYTDPRPVTLFHATTSDPSLVTTQILAALAKGHSVITAAEWMFHPWLRYGDAAEALDAAARAQATHVIGCGINPGFCFEALPLLLSRTVHNVAAVDILRVADVSGIGPSDFGHVGLGLNEEAFRTQVASHVIEGHMGFPESIAAVAECLDLAVDRMTDHLVPTLATRPLQLSHREVSLGQVVGITQTAIGYVADAPVLRMTLEMFLDPASYGRSPREVIDIRASRSFNLTVQPAAPPAEGAAAMMVYAAKMLPAMRSGLVSLLDLPIGESRARLRVTDTHRSPQGTEFAIGERSSAPA